jgi:hypothetical protein
VERKASKNRAESEENGANPDQETRRNRFMPLSEVQEHYPNKPSIKWLSKRAALTRTKTRAGKNVYVFRDRLDYLIEGRIWPSGEMIEAHSEKNPVRSIGVANSLRKTKTVRLSGDPSKEARELLMSKKRARL